MKSIKLKIGDKEFEAHFGFGFFEKAMENENLPDNNILSLPVNKQIYYSISYGLERNGLEPISRYDFHDLLDDMEVDEFKEITEKFSYYLLRSMEKKMKLSPTERKEYEKQMQPLAKKFEPTKKVTAAK